MSCGAAAVWAYPALSWTSDPQFRARTVNAPVKRRDDGLFRLNEGRERERGGRDADGENNMTGVKIQRQRRHNGTTETERVSAVCRSSSSGTHCVRVFPSLEPLPKRREAFEQSQSRPGAKFCPGQENRNPCRPRTFTDRTIYIDNVESTLPSEIMRFRSAHRIPHLSTLKPSREISRLRAKSLQLLQRTDRRTDYS